MSTIDLFLTPRSSARPRPHRQGLAGLALCLAVLMTLVTPVPSSAAPVPRPIAGQSLAQAAGSLGASYAAPGDVVAALAGPGLAVSNIAFEGSPNALGTFTGGSSIIGFEQGAVISTGDITNIVGPNSSDETETQFGTAGDPQLAALTGYDSFDAASLDFDFVPNGRTFTFRYVFASEEYNEFVYSTYEDAFLFQVNGVNCATVDGQRVSINTINAGNPVGRNPSNADLYRNNDLSDGGGAINTEFDGLTVVMTCTASVTPGVINHLRISIADTFDARLDSAIFIELGSITTNQAPAAADDATVTTQDTAVTVDVLANDSDPDGDTLTVSAVTQGTNGSVAINADNTLSYMPNSGFFGSDTFTYTVVDPFGAPDTATVSATVNQAPTATPTNTPEPTATLTPEPTATNTPDATATEAATVEPTATNTIEPTATETETSTPEPTATFTSVPAPPVCAVAYPSLDKLWPPNGDFHAIEILGLSDANGAPVNIVITAISQDEHVSKDGPDARGVGSSTAELRAVRDGGGNGRVYHVLFTATDANGGSCGGEVLVSVPHDEDDVAVDDTSVVTVDSTTPANKPKQK